MHAAHLMHDFKNFAVRDNIVDTAIGIIIGSSLTNIISSFVKDILMPPLSVIMGGIHIDDYKITLKEAVLNSKGNIAEKAITVNFGSFVQTVVDFSIIALCLYLAIKATHAIKKRLHMHHLEQEEHKTPKHTKQEELLMEIRDLLAQSHKTEALHIPEKISMVNEQHQR